jgi:menaquinone-9 beta-reductase
MNLDALDQSEISALQKPSRQSSVSDVLIAGGGIAGSSLAVMLGRRGFNVELFESALFPREKPCGEGLMPAGVAVLRRLGLAAAVGGCPIYGVRFRYLRRGRITGPNAIRFPSPGIGQRRRVLDQTLLSAAKVTEGVRVHTGIRVEGPIREHGTVVGLMAGGRAFHAPLVVAADGARSTMRLKLGLNGPNRRGRFGIRAHFRLPSWVTEIRWVEIFVGDRHEIYVTPLPDRQIAVAILADVGVYHTHTRSQFLNLCGAFPALVSRLDGAEQITPILGASPLSGTALAGVMPGFALLGDAAGFADPIAGTGMTEALVTAELLATHIANHRRDDPGWLQSFERRRGSIVRRNRIFTKTMLWLSRRPRLSKRLMGALDRWPFLARYVPLH